MFLSDDLHVFLLHKKIAKLLNFEIFKFLNIKKDMLSISSRLLFYYIYRLRKAFGCKYSLLC
jgi:hypothetical protein